VVAVALALAWGAGSGRSAPAPQGEDATSVSFTAAGDFGSGENGVSVFESISRLAPDLHLALGDLSYGEPGEEAAWCRLVTSRVGTGFPFELLAGNHESDGQNGNIADFAACLPNRLPGLVGAYGREYYVDVPQVDPQVRFVAISPGVRFRDGTPGYDEGDRSFAWTAGAIDGARNAGIPWIVVSMHKPCLSIGEYGCDPGPDILNLLIEKKVDLVLTGHEHLYQRTAQLSRGDGCSALVPAEYRPECVADAGDQLVKGAGTVFVTVGTGGVALRDLHEDDPEAGYMVSAQGRNNDPTWGSLEVSLTPSRLVARFVPAAGGDFEDEFSIASG